MAMFGFADFGLIGDNGNIFKNNFYATVGLGIRIKNEHLIFEYDEHPFGRSPE